jgi:hypothetical protein
MLAREIYPGALILVDEETAWKELLFGFRPTLPHTAETMAIYPGSDSLCLVEDLSIAPPTLKQKTTE